MKRALRKAERVSGDGTAVGGTGATIIKFLPAPLARLADKQRIGSEELRAADDIATAFHAQAGALLIKPPSLEKRDATYHGREAAWVIDAVTRYKRWAAHWSARARRGDRTLVIVIAAVVDERAFHAIEADVGIRHGHAARIVIAALRDYAAPCGMDRSPHRRSLDRGRGRNFRRAGAVRRAHGGKASVRRPVRNRSGGRVERRPAVRPAVQFEAATIDCSKRINSRSGISHAFLAYLIQSNAMFPAHNSICTCTFQSPRTPDPLSPLGRHGPTVLNALPPPGPSPLSWHQKRGCHRRAEALGALPTLRTADGLRSEPTKGV
jgi:hypothetical protein